MTSFFLSLSIISAAAGEAAFHVLSELVWVRIVCKLVTAVSILAYAYGCRHRKEWGFPWLFAALFFSASGDVVILVSFLTGVILFAMGHLCLVLLFLRRQELARSRWILWGAASLGLAAVILILGHPMGVYAYGAAAYAPVILLMVFSAVRQKGRIRAASLIYVASDLLLALYQWKRIHPTVHILYMALFYLALILLAGMHTSLQDGGKREFRR